MLICMTENSKPLLSPEELERYARHIVLPEIGGAGQQKLKRARVLVVGAGGLGSPILEYLAAAGIGTLGVVDDDIVSLSNLQRQVIHGTADIGRLKVESAGAAIARINPHCHVESHAVRLDASNAADLITAYDVIVDACDNAETRYLVADVTAVAHRPLVSAAIGRFDGTVTVYMPYTKNADGAHNPGLRDLFPDAPPPGSVPTCAEAGVLGVLPGVIGSLQAMEVIKLVTGIGEPLVGRLLLYDALSTRFETIRYRSRPEK